MRDELSSHDILTLWFTKIPSALRAMQYAARLVGKKPEHFWRIPRWQGGSLPWQRTDDRQSGVTAGVSAVENRFVNWGAGVVDLDNDGNPDLFFVTGNVYPEVEAQVPTYPFKTPRVVFRNLGGGRFEEVLDLAGPAIAEPHASRGCAFGDFDNDGDIDILIVNLNETPSLLRNDLKSGNHWLKVKLIGTRSNRSAIGTRITCLYGNKKQAQKVMAQPSFYSSNDRRLHFGLGKAITADLEIRWTNGFTQAIKDVKADQILTLREPAELTRPGISKPQA